MTDDLVLSDEDLVENPTARVPVCLCLDTSGSMGGAPIEELNGGVRTFLEAIESHDMAKYAAEIAVVTFGGFGAQTTLDFGPVGDREVPHLCASGGTPMGEGVTRALDLLEARKAKYAAVGLDYYQPWLVLMTDGAPTDFIEHAASRCAALVEARKLTVFPIAIGAAANLDVLARFSPGRTPLRLNGLDFKAFFEWLSKSVARVSQSMPGESVPLDTKGIQGWAAI